MPAHLLIDISAHGLGHLAQTAPVIEALRRRLPNLQLTIRSAISRQRLESYLARDFAHVCEARDIGFVMSNAVDIDLAASGDAYRDFHRQWSARIDREAAWLHAQAVSAVLTNVAYLPLAGAARLGIPCASVCSLNWADLFIHYFAAEPWATSLHNEIVSAYSAADGFLRASPGLPMAGLHRLRKIGPIARTGTRDRIALARQLGIADGKRWVLVAMGGMDFPLPVERWPGVDGVIWLVPAAWQMQHGNIVAFDAGPIGFADVLASVDAVITKPGYGTFVEAACHGVPLVYLQRDDWPETRHFSEWLAVHARSLALSRGQLMQGEVMAALTQLWHTPPPETPRATGAEEAAELLGPILRLR